MCDSNKQDVIRCFRDVDYLMSDTKRQSKNGVDKQMCNVYVPPEDDSRDYNPVLVFVHGGSWSRGDRSHRWFDVYGNLAKYFAKAGYVVVVAGYRLSPEVQHPTHCEDVAQCLKFVKLKIKTYNGNPDLVFLMGHSAGGHICASLVLNTAFLDKVDLDHTFIKGCVTVSGVYDVTATALMSQIVSRFVIIPAFGRREDGDYSDCSPIEYVRRGAPPFLVLNAEKDWGLDRQSEHFVQKLCNAGVECKWKRYHRSGTNHLSIIGLSKLRGEPYKEMCADSIDFLDDLVRRRFEGKKMSKHLRGNSSVVYDDVFVEGLEDQPQPVMDDVAQDGEDLGGVCSL
ncbi:kynurenine formamidase [Acrasis kona]|uniref:Kynurenine formamidase n=1 Tax=Acrasis kona TaxID=1008807 RepID=A0AAW2ZFK0_9EUKA